MKKLTSLITLTALVIGLSGCATGSKPILSPSLVQQGVTAGTKSGTTKWPTAIPYVKASKEVICSSANSTNISPANIVAALESSVASLKTAEGVLIVEGAVFAYTLVWNALGADAVANGPLLKEYLQAVCNGLTLGLPPVGAGAQARARRESSLPDVNWPHIKF